VKLVHNHVQAKRTQLIDDIGARLLELWRARGARPKLNLFLHIFKGAVTVTLKDGTTLTEVEDYNRGSAENPMTEAELRAKFDENADGMLDAAARDRVADAVATLDELGDASLLVDLVTGKR